MSPFLTYMLVVALIIGVIGMNISIIRDPRFKSEGIVYAFVSPKLYLWFVPLVVIFFSVFLFNV